MMEKSIQFEHLYTAAFYSNVITIKSGYACISYLESSMNQHSLVSNIKLCLLLIYHYIIRDQRENFSVGL
jgi:hypothetical protein